MRIRAFYSGNRINAYWSRGTLFNFGDMLTPVLLRHYGYSPVFTQISNTQLVSVGSILERLRQDYDGVILDSGFIKSSSNIEFPHANIVGVRGMLTREQLGNPYCTFVGDPGLLVDRLVTSESNRQNILGIVPHYIDKSDWRLAKLARMHPAEVKIIDVQRQPMKVIKEVGQCEHILSSSLHGLVVADSLGIPNSWITLSDGVAGDGFKFCDYYSALGVSRRTVTLTGTESVAELINLTTPPPPRTSNVKGHIEAAFVDLGSQLG